MKKKASLDICRLIAAFLIVAIHIYPLNTINQDLDYMFTRVFCRIALPLFLMITGYYVLPKAKADVDILIKYTKKIAIMYLICILLYLPLNIYMKDIKNITIFSVITSIFCKGTFYHLWYFPALILGIWIIYPIIKKLNTKVQLIVLLLLYLIGLGGDSYYGIVSQSSIMKNFYQGIFTIFTYTRNGLFFVPIFLYIGYYLHGLESKISIKKSIIITVLSIVLMEIEGYILYHYQIPHHTSMYLFLIPTAIFLFLTLLKLNQTQNKTIRTISTIIYILHPLMLVIVRLLAKIIKLENIFITNSLVFYICVCLMSLISSFIIEKVIRKSKNFYK